MLTELQLLLFGLVVNCNIKYIHTYIIVVDLMLESYIIAKITLLLYIWNKFGMKMEKSTEKTIRSHFHFCQPTKTQKAGEKQ